MLTSYSGLAGAGIAVVVLLLMFPILLAGTLAILVVSNRADPDPSGKRPMSVYFFTGAFVTLWLTYFGIIAIAASLISLIGHASTHDHTNMVIRGVTLGVLLTVIAGWAYMAHRTRGLALADSEVDSASPAKRVARSYVAAISFITTVILVVTAIALIYSILGMIAPGVYMMPSRMESFRSALNELVVLGITASIFMNHQRLAPAALRLMGGSPTTSRAVTE